MVKKEFVKSLMVGMMITVSLTGCGDAEEKVIKGEEIVESGIRMENSDTAEEDGSIAVSDEAEVSEPEEETTYTEKGDVYLMDNVYNEGEQVDLASFELERKEYNLIKSVNVYYTDETLAGYTKENAPVYVVSSNEEWSFCSFDTSGYLIKNDELMDSILLEAEKEAKDVEPKEQEPIHIDATIKSDTVPVETNEAVEENVAPTESNKYTPDEAISIYRSAMEAGGITWDPSLKDVTSWGTGWIYLDKGQPEWCASTNLESFAMGDSAGNPWTKYYLEVTGSDENAVYITEWHG